jgi:hypothetical protein
LYTSPGCSILNVFPGPAPLWHDIGRQNPSPAN